MPLMPAVVAWRSIARRCSGPPDIGKGYSHDAYQTLAAGAAAWPQPCSYGASAERAVGHRGADVDDRLAIRRRHVELGGPGKLHQALERRFVSQELFQHGVLPDRGVFGVHRPGARPGAADRIARQLAFFLSDGLLHAGGLDVDCHGHRVAIPDAPDGRLLQLCAVDVWRRTSQLVTGLRPGAALT